jgi:rhamnosyltransferase
VSASPRISVVIPTLNGAATLPALLEAIECQHVPGGVEVVAVDSGSSDGTLDLLTSRVAALLRVAADDFNHGATRNLAIGRARGSLVVLTVQDALPVAATWLDTLTRPFDREPSLAATVARQVPRQEASALTRHYLAMWPAASSLPWTSRVTSTEEFEALPAAERLTRCVVDSVASCLRRAVWERHPFVPTPIAEDLAWARAVLLAGHTIAHVPEAVVVHSHDRSPAYEFARTRVVHARLHALFGLQTIPTWPLLLRAVTASVALHARLEWQHPGQWARAAGLAAAWPAAQFLGARDAIAGRDWRPGVGRV